MNVNIGLQLYSVRDSLAADPWGTLAQIAEAGFTRLEAANHNARNDPGVGFGVVPVGTGNDFAACLGVARDPLVAADGIVGALREGRALPVDLAKISRDGGSERWFGAVLAAGFDAVVNERANSMTRPRGARRYDLAILVELARLRGREYEIELDGEVFTGPGVLVAVGNCASYGGGLRIAPDADPTDGLLDVVFAEPMGRGALMRLKPRLRRGTHVSDARVRVWRARRVVLRAEGIVAYADGERVGALPLALDCVPGAVRLLI